MPKGNEPRIRDILPADLIFTKWLSKYGHNFGPFINGRCSESTQNLQDADDSEALYKEISVVINEDLINDSIKSAQEAFVLWKKNPDRGDILRSVCESLQNEAELFAEISFTTHGISYNYSTEKDLKFALNTFSFYANWANRINTHYQNYEPYGVTAGVLLDDNSPLMMLSCLIASTLASGNTIVLLVKPHYSLISLAFALTLTQSGVPPGVVNVLPCVDEELFPTIASKFSRLKGGICNKIKSLPSSVSISSVMSNNFGVVPMLVLASADLQSVVSCIMDIVNSPSLVPWYTNVIVIEELIFENFVTHLKSNVSDINKYTEYKNDHELNFEHGKYIQHKEMQGYEVLRLIKDYVCCLFLINNADASECPIIKDALYPPVRVISVISARTVEEAILKVNTKNRGLSASVWTNDSVQSTTIPFMLKYGTVWVNSNGHFDSSVPFSSWSSYGHGTFCGKRGLFGDLQLINESYGKSQKLYNCKLNAVFPKKDVNQAINDAYNGFKVWSNLEMERRTYYLRTIANEQSRLWDSHYKMVMSETSEELWERGINYLKLWSNYTNEKIFDTVLFVNDFTVICKSEAIGVICILAGSAPFDVLMYSIAAAVVYGNTVVVGICSDENSAVLAMELVNIWSLLCGRVNIVVNTANDLWSNFMSNEHCSSIWYVNQHLLNIPSIVNIQKNIVKITPPADSSVVNHEIKFEIYCTKQKSIWLPRM